MPNPALTAFTLPYGLPDFAGISLDDYRDGFEEGLRQQEAEVEAIADSDAEPTFENTVEALERSGDLLDRVVHVLWTVMAADGSREMRSLETELAPRFAAHQTALLLDPRLWGKISALHEHADDARLEPEQRQLLERAWLTRLQAGAGLDDAARARVSQINTRIAQLESDFNNRLIHDTADAALVVDSVEDLEGLNADQIRACAEAASARDLAGKWLIDLVNTTQHPLLSSLRNRETRRRLFEAQRSRGHRGNEYDTRQIVLELVRLRAERAGLFGLPNHVAYKVADASARTPEAIEKVVYPMAAPARRNAEKEAAALQEEADLDADARGIERFTLAPWDWAFYAAKVRERTFGVDEETLRPWFEYDAVLRDGVFYAAHELFGITFEERHDLHGWLPEVRVFEVFDADGTPLGLFLHDVLTRDTKNGGAWMNNIVEQSGLLGRRPIVCNTLNVARPASGQPILLTLDNVRTMFHEFGHALHGLFSTVKYASLSGTNVPRDFVEYPSQCNEMWATWPSVLAHYARHVETGEPLPAAALPTVQAQEQFNQGFATTEYLGAALLDQEWHKLAPGTVVGDVDTFEADALARIGLDYPLVPPRYSTTYFQHTFGSGYDGAYYSYIWSEALDADTVDWFVQNGGLTRQNGQHYRDELLSRGRSREPLDSFRAFRGRDVDITPLLRRRGLLAEGE